MSKASEQLSQILATLERAGLGKSVLPTKTTPYSTAYQSDEDRAADVSAYYNREG